MEIKKIYLAGPEVFLPDAIQLGQAKKDACSELGYQGLFPFDNEGGTAREIFRNNVNMMQQADCIIANLTPFRGPSSDVGTVFELGFMAGMGKVAVGYTNDPRNFLERVKKHDPGSLRSVQRKEWVDSQNRVIEDFGLFENLMIAECLAGGTLVVERGVPEKDRLSDLTAFRKCLRLLKGASHFHTNLSWRDIARQHP